jgi:hypothetical protein
VKGTVGVLIDEAKDGAATANLDIVGMRTQAQDLDGPAFLHIEVQFDHRDGSFKARQGKAAAATI